MLTKEAAKVAVVEPNYQKDKETAKLLLLMTSLPVFCEQSWVI
jgi:hypothetical protein